MGWKGDLDKGESSGFGIISTICIMIGPPDSTICQQSLNTFLTTCDELNVPLVSHKVEGPSTFLVVLGIEIDMGMGHLRLPSEKLARLRQQLMEWNNRKSCMRKDLESLISCRNHACKVVKPRRSFPGCMLDLLHRSSVGTTPRPQNHIQLNREV